MEHGELIQVVRMLSWYILGVFSTKCVPVEQSDAYNGFIQLHHGLLWFENTPNLFKKYSRFKGGLFFLAADFPFLTKKVGEVCMRRMITRVRAFESL